MCGVLQLKNIYRFCARVIDTVTQAGKFKFAEFWSAINKKVPYHFYGIPLCKIGGKFGQYGHTYSIFSAVQYPSVIYRLRVFAVQLELQIGVFALVLAISINAEIL